MIVSVLGNDSDPNGSLVHSDRDRDHPAGAWFDEREHDDRRRHLHQPASNYTGTDEFFYTVQDNEGAVSSPAKVTVTITGNPPPVAVADTASTTMNTAVVIGVLGNDSDPNGTLARATVTVTTAPRMVRRA